MKKTVLASAVLLAMAGAASATPDFGTITIDGKTADSSALATETNGIVKIEGTSEIHGQLPNCKGLSAVFKVQLPLRTRKPKRAPSFNSVAKPHPVETLIDCLSYGVAS